MAWGAEVWLALASAIPLLFLAFVYRYSQSLKLEASKSQEARPLRGRFWQLPLFGESVELFWSALPDNFILPRINRYGPIFRSHLLGHPAVCLTSAEGVKFVLSSPKLFKPVFGKSPASYVLGQYAVMRLTGPDHTMMRKLIMSPVSAENLKRFVPRIDEAAKWCFQSFEASLSSTGSANIKVYEEGQKFSFRTALDVICKTVPEADLSKVFRAVCNLDKGVASTFPVDHPWTPYGKALRGRKELCEYFTEVIAKRRAGATGEKGAKLEHYEDLIDSFIQADLSLEYMLDNINLTLFAAFDTTASTLAWVLHSLCVHRDILAEVQAENDALARKRTSSGDETFSWSDVQHLPLTMRVIQETQRTINVVPLALRVAAEDVVFNGMLIPKGWTVLSWFRFFHLDPNIYPDPYKFDPDRFKTPPKINTFTPFGSGNKVCPGMELAKLDILLYVHRFVLSYEFESMIPLEARPSKLFWLLPHPAKGLPLRIRKRVVLSSRRA